MGVRGIFALGRAAVVPTGDHRAARVRRHVSDTEAHRRGLDVDDLDDPDDLDDDRSDRSSGDESDASTIDSAADADDPAAVRPVGRI